jgi:hypothetical protein
MAPFPLLNIPKCPWTSQVESSFKTVVPTALAAANLPRSDLSSYMPTTILICGSPADGFQIVGLFADSGDAEAYAEDHSLRDWWVAELTSPEAFAESQRHPAVQAG